MLGGVPVAHSSIDCVDNCLTFRPVSFDHCIVCSSIYCVDNCLTFRPVSFDHCVVCSSLYVYDYPLCMYKPCSTSDNCYIIQRNIKNTSNITDIPFLNNMYRGGARVKGQKPQPV